MTLKDIAQKMLNEVAGTGIQINFSTDGVQIHWNGVNQLDCDAGDAAKAIPLIKALEKLGMEDC